MKTEPTMEPVDFAFMGSLVGWVAFVPLDSCRFVRSGAAGWESIGPQMIGIHPERADPQPTWTQSQIGQAQETALRNKGPTGAVAAARILW